MRRRQSDMSRCTGFRWGRPLAGVGLALLVIVLAAPAAARAGCGDYVVIGSKPAPGANAEMGTGLQEHRSMPAAPGPRPCSGPRCGRGAPLLPAVPVEISPTQMKPKVCLPGTLLLTASHLVARLTNEPPFLSERHDLAVYHPPRHCFA
jgi:hypothetical protein